MNVKKFYTAQELADMQLDCLPHTPINVRSRAKKENWLSRPRQGRGGGLEYTFSGLPKEVQTEIKAKELRALMPKPNSQERTVALMGRDLDELTDKDRQIADMRMLMALLVADYEDDMGRTRAIEYVSKLSRENALPVIDGKDYNQICAFALAKHNRIVGVGTRKLHQWVLDANKCHNGAERLRMLAPQTQGRPQTDITDDAAKTNQQRLQETADKARQAYEAMANDGKASSDKLQSAFADYAQKAIQANQGVIDETLKHQLAEHKLQAVIDQTGKVTINSLAVQSNALSTTTQELDKYKDSFKTLGLDMGVFAGGLPSKIKETVDAFSDIGKVAGANVKQLAIAYQAATTAIGDNKAGQEALNTALVKAVGNSQVLAEKIKTLANEQKYATTNTQEQQKALDALGVSMSAINSQMSTSGQKMADNLKIGLVAIKEQAKGADELKAALNQALDTSIKAAQTKADFEAIKKAIIDAGLSAQVSSEQMNRINTGATGGAKAVAELSEKTTKYSSTISDNSKKTDENTTATQRNIIAKKELKDANQQAAQSTNTLSEGSLRMAQGLAGLVSKVKQGTQELTKFGVSSEDAAKAASNIHNRIIGSHVNGFDDFLRRLKLSQNEIRQQVENFKEARSAALAMTEALSKPTAGVRELAAAQKVLERATNATVGEIKLMDKATLKGLQSQIKQVEERMRSLSDSAKQTVQDLQSELAELQGNETEVLRIKHAQKLADLETKIAQAKTQGNSEALVYYQKALELQQKINTEENRQASTKASQSATQVNTEDVTFGIHQNPSSELSAKDIGDMWAKHLDGIKQEAKREARAEFIQEMQDDIKRRAR